MKRVLVAGATGYIGRFVAQAFKRHGHWVRVLARSPDKLGRRGVNLEPAIADMVDETFVGEATRPETLAGLCDRVDVVFSSVGITRQRDGVTFMDVDYQGNRNILDRAVESSVERFIFIHVFNAHLFGDLEMVRARGRFVNELRESSIPSSVICPTGYFSDMGEFFRMAQRGTVYLLGDGQARINPIHGADLAEVCVDALNTNPAELAAGGPDTYTHQQIAELAFSVLGKPPRIRRIPIWLVKTILAPVRPFSKRIHTLGNFMTTVSENDFVAPAIGNHSLRDFFEELAEADRR